MRKPRLGSEHYIPNCHIYPLACMESKPSSLMTVTLLSLKVPSANRADARMDRDHSLLEDV